ncbi:hypothetical protein ACHAW6_005149, partial [Cyclotella cf. meneghiniana]
RSTANGPCCELVARSSNPHQIPSRIIPKPTGNSTTAHIRYPKCTLQRRTAYRPSELSLSFDNDNKPTPTSPHCNIQNSMNTPLRLFIRSRPSWQPCSSVGRHPYSTTANLSAMKSGTQIPGLDSIYPKHDPKKGEPDPEKTAPVAKPRSEYPSWVNNLVNAPPTLAKLRSINIEEGTDDEMKRYLKLVRRGKIKEDNLVAEG